jgi:hypothetical protein
MLLIALCLPQGVFANGDMTHVFIDPNTTTVTTCGTQMVEVRVEDVTDLTGYHLEISFDPNVIEVTDVVNGGFLAPPGESALYEPTNDIDNINGLISFGLVQQGDGLGDPLPKSGEGVLLEITFHGIAPNKTSPIMIDTDNTTLVDWPDASVMDFTSANGSVSTESCPPEDIVLNGYTLPENAPAGTEIGGFLTIDPDNPNDSFVYELTSGVGDDDNDSFEIGGSSLLSKKVFNYEEKNIYRIRVRSTDWGDKMFEKTFLIVIMDVNDPPVADDQDVFIEKNPLTEVDPVDITLTGSDEDGDELSFDLLSGPAEGALSGTAPDLTYTPGEGFIGADSFTFRVFDGEAYSEPAVVSIIIDEKKATDYYFPLFMHSSQ